MPAPDAAVTHADALLPMPTEARPGPHRRAARAKILVQFSLALAALVGAGTATPVLAQFAPARPAPEAECSDANCRTTYDAAFFAIYAPVTALDMVNNLPGFNLDNGNTGSRGFGGAAGNILINSQRVSAKSESPSDLLSRIPAADVERIIVIRGQVGGTDLRGQSVIADVIRRDSGATGAWSLRASTQQPNSRFLPSGTMSYSDSHGGLSYTVGASVGRSQFQVKALERVLDGSGDLLEERRERFSEIEDSYDLTLNGTYQGGQTLYGFNAQYAWEQEDGGERSLREPVDADPFLLEQGGDEEENALELGFDAERALSETFSAKVITLYRRDEQERVGTLVRGEPEAPGELITEALTDQLATETILRVETDYSGIQGHLIEASIEGARNRLDSDFELRRRIGGMLVPVPVPGARTQVEEERVDLSIGDSFAIGALAVDLELAAEASEIRQTGGFAEERSFFFWKPSMTLSYTRDDGSLLRGRLLRQVSQLDFDDFASAADLGDDELALGNPQLSPETTVTLDLTWETRFNSIGLLSLTAFYDWIDDVEDVLPLEGGLEVPGNIGSGWRYGLRGELTTPLDFLGISNARLDMNARWQDSGVDDPLTGQERVLSNERAWRVEAEFRQDLPEARLGWGFGGNLNDGFTRFGLDELDRFKGTGSTSAFIESRAIESLRIRLGISSIFRTSEDRDRQVFEGPRNISPLDFRELRDRTGFRRIFLEVRGVF